MSRLPFPRTLSAFQSRFATEEACVHYLFESRWADGYACPRCGHDEAYELELRPIFKCRKCSYQVSVTAGTVLHRTRLSLRDWFSAAYLVATHTPGISAVQRQRQLGLRRYETAWGLLQKLRRAMVRPERDRISGEVEVDETYVGGVEVGRRGGRVRDSTKTIVVGAVEIRGQGSGRVRLSVIEDLSAASLVGFLEQSVAPCSVVHTDGWGGYRPLANKGYDHRRETQGHAKNAVKLFPACTGCSRTSKRGWRERTTGWASSTCNIISTSMCFVSTGDALRWQPFSRSSDSPASTNRPPTTCCMMVSQPDKQKPTLSFLLQPSPFQLSSGSPSLLTHALGRARYQRQGLLDAPSGYRNGMENRVSCRSRPARSR